MSAEVEIAIAEYEDVLLIPVAAVVETDSAAFCWVQSAEKVQRRRITLGDSNGVFTIVADGINDGDEVFLNPAALELPTADDSQTSETETQEQTERVDTDRN